MNARKNLIIELTEKIKLANDKAEKDYKNANYLVKRDKIVYLYVIKIVTNKK